MSNQITEEEAKKIASGDYGRALMELSFQFVLPIYWKKPQSHGIEINSGTMFFIDTGNRLLAITASHVYREYLQAKADDDSTISQLGFADFDLTERLIDNNEKVDIATFNINEKEISTLGRISFSGTQKTWPPTPPQQGQTIFFGGYPKIERIIGKEVDINFGLSFVLCLASNIDSNMMTCQIERDYMVPIKDSPQLAADYFWAGTSGAPVIKIVRSPIESFQLAGVVSQCWDNNTILVSHVRHINADGTIKE